ncbi:MAG: O-antigen ligase family protein [Pseudomonadota bacterium]|nr:O-antigen ligase family protein [Pseudomonadota bacterium]
MHRLPDRAAALGLLAAAFLLPWLAFVADKALAWVTGIAALLALPVLVRERAHVRWTFGNGWARLALASLLALLALLLLSPFWGAAEHADAMQKLAWRTALAFVAGLPLVLAAGAGTVDRRHLVPALLAGLAVAAAITVIDAATGHLLLKIRTVFGDRVPTPDGVMAAAYEQSPDRYLRRFNDFWVVAVLSAAFVLSGLRRAWLFPAGLAVLLFVSLKTISETAQLISLIGIVAWLLCRFTGRAGVFVLSALTVAVILATPVLFPALNGLFLSVFDGSNLLEWKILERFEIWAALSETVAAAPVLGHGIEYQRLAVAYPGPGTYFLPDKLWHPHSLPVQLWQDLGLLGALAGSALAAGCFGATLRMDPGERPAMAALVAMSLGALAATHSIWLGWWLCVFFLLAAFAVARARTTVEHA